MGRVILVNFYLHYSHNFHYYLSVKVSCITYSNGDSSKAFSFSVNVQDRNLYILKYTSWKWTEEWQQFNYISNYVFCDTILTSTFCKGDIECIHLKLWGNERKGVEAKIRKNFTLTIWYFSKYRKGFSLYITEIFLFVKICDG